MNNENKRVQFLPIRKVLDEANKEKGANDTYFLYDFGKNPSTIFTFHKHKKEGYVELWFHAINDETISYDTNLSGRPEYNTVPYLVLRFHNLESLINFESDVFGAGTCFNDIDIGIDGYDEHKKKLKEVLKNDT